MKSINVNKKGFLFIIFFALCSFAFADYKVLMPPSGNLMCDYLPNQMSVKIYNGGYITIPESQIVFDKSEGFTVTITQDQYEQYNLTPTTQLNVIYLGGTAPPLGIFYMGQSSYFALNQTVQTVSLGCLAM